MNKVLVVEDEKLIRQGIAAMIKRSGVPVAEVIECNNGLAAMDILEDQHVDVVFTDIRMPKMNGIELVQAIQELENPPLAVAISGYDDFSYAVEMMRQGVREYILKPVEREKLKSVLEKLDNELNHRKEDQEKTEAMDNQLLKYMLRDKDSSGEEIELMSRKLLNEVGEEFIVIVATEQSSLKLRVGITLNSVQGENVFIVKPDGAAELQNGKYIGISDVYTSLAGLKNAYKQALQRRSEAFLLNTSIVDSELPTVPEELIKLAQKCTDSAAISARVQMMGTDRAKDLKKEWDGFFIAAARGQIPAESFLEAIHSFVSEYSSVYKKPVPNELLNPLESDCLESYREKFMEFVLSEQQTLGASADADQVATKIHQAVNYINENYANDLNMAVVSNHISMNYSLFSAEFKNVTGTNFVTYLKDLRMGEAKRLLTETDLKVNEISTKVGYDNEKHFMKSFKAYVGVSPSEYRRNTAR
jgi:YesN/AraC family two-component response regulator